MLGVIEREEGAVKEEGGKKENQGYYKCISCG